MSEVEQAAKIAQLLAGVDGGKQVLGLLRWPQPNQHKAMQLPLVSMKRDGANLTLLARSVDEYLHRWGPDSITVIALIVSPSGGSV